MIDTEAREFYATEDPDPRGLASARISVEHIEHHGQPLQWVGSNYTGDLSTHRFRCRERGCRLTLAIHVTDP